MLSFYIKSSYTFSRTDFSAVPSPFYCPSVRGGPLQWIMPLRPSRSCSRIKYTKKATESFPRKQACFTKISVSQKIYELQLNSDETQGVSHTLEKNIENIALQAHAGDCWRSLVSCNPYEPTWRGLGTKSSGIFCKSDLGHLGRLMSPGSRSHAVQGPKTA